MKSKIVGVALVVLLICLVPLTTVRSQKGELNSPETTSIPLSSFITVHNDLVNNFAPAIAYNSRHNEYLVVWWNDHGATRDIYARRVTTDGQLKSEFTVVTAENQWNWQPAVAYSPAQDQYLVVYTYKVNDSDYDLWARRIAWNGGWMSQEFQVNTEGAIQWYPNVAYNSAHDEYLVVYENYWSDSLHDIAAQRIRASDGVLLSWRNIATGANQVRRFPDVAYLAEEDEYLITYSLEASASDNNIKAKITDFNMGYLGPEVDLVSNNYNQQYPAVTTSPNEYLVVWEDGPGAWERTIYGIRISGAGDKSNYIGLFTGTNLIHYEPDAAYSSVYGYVTVAWYKVSDTNYDIKFRLSRPGVDYPSGNVYDLDATINSQKAPVIACERQGSCLVVYEDNYSLFSYDITGRIIQVNKVSVPFARK